MERRAPRFGLGTRTHRHGGCRGPADHRARRSAPGPVLAGCRAARRGVAGPAGWRGDLALRARALAHAHTHVAASPHFHLHSHASSPDHGHSHTGGDARRSLGFGIAHGLAGSGAIAALLVAAAPDAATRIAYFAAFGAGTIVGMLGVSLTLSVLVRFAAERGARWATVLHVGAAVGSVVAGVAVGWSVLSS